MRQTKVRKKLIEVTLPLNEINKAAARENSIRHGHPSTLHLWWARHSPDRGSGVPAQAAIRLSAWPAPNAAM